MKMSSISGVTYLVSDLQKTSAFYEALGFRLGKQDEGHLLCYVNWFWLDFIAQSSQSDLNTPQDAQMANRGAGTYLHIKVESIDEFYAGVLSKGMKPESEPYKQKSGDRVFVLRDPDGYKLVFFEKK